MNGKIIKIIGLAATVVGAGVSLLTAWVGEKQMDMKVEEKVREAVAKLKDE